MDRHLNLWPDPLPPGSALRLAAIVDDKNHMTKLLQFQQDNLTDKRIIIRY